MSNLVRFKCIKITQYCSKIAKRLERRNIFSRFLPEAPCYAFLEVSEFLQLLENAVVASSTLNGNNNKITEAYYSIISFI